MRITLVWLLAALLNLHPADAYSQSTQVSLHFDQVSVERVLHAIERQTGLYCVYNSKSVNVDRLVSVKLDKASVKEALDKIFDDTGVTYEIDAKHIILSPRMPAGDNQQRRSINGTVKDTAGEAIIGANIMIKGNESLGTVTDLDGRFSLDVPSNGILVVTYIGYKTKELPINDKNTYTIVLEEDAKALDEVIVVGFMTQKKANVTGAVSQVAMDKTLGDRPVTNLGAALQGAMPGFTSSSSAIPGGENKFNVRGLESINGGAPLILVDNVVFNDLNLLNPADIESVSVLKDASSAAIYGARAAFGVVLITTKKAKKNETLSINYNNNFAVSRVNNLLEMASPTDVIRTLKEGGYTSIWSGQNIDTYLQLLEEYKAHPALYPRGYAEVNGTKYFLRQTDAYEELFESAWKQTHNLSAQGGSERIRYRLSTGYTRQDGVLVTDKDAFTRINVSGYVSGDITKWLSTSLDMNYSKGEKNYPVLDEKSEIGNLWKPNLPSYHPVGTLPYGTDGEEYPVMTPSNVIRLAQADKTVTDNTRILSRTVVKPFRGLEAILEYSYQISQNDYEAYCNAFTVHQGLAESLKPSTSTTPFTRYDSSTRYTTVNAFATYNNSFLSETHNVSAIAGFNQEKSDYRKLYSQAYNMISNELPSLSGSNGETPAKTWDEYDQYALRSLFFRASYNYKQRYFLEVNGRYDLSSKFPKEYRNGFFPSVSAGWSLLSEPFMKQAGRVLSTLKLRGSYGTLGNQNINNYGYMPTMEAVRADWLMSGTQPRTLNAPGMVRANYTWEKVTTVNGGLDFGFLNNKLTGVFEIYRRNTIGMLGPGEDLPGVAGATAPLQNAADMKTNGWEVSLHWRDRIGYVNYGVGFNLYDSRSVITKYKNDNKTLTTADDSDLYYTGKKIGEIWGYLTDGFYTADDFEANGALKKGVVSINGVTSHPGDIKYKNLRDDETHTNQISSGENTYDNPGDKTVIGNSRPRMQYGANGFVDWKGFNFSFILQGVGKCDAWIGGAITFPMSSQYGTVYKHQVGKIWTENNPGAFYGRIYENAGSSQEANQYKSDKFLYNAAYLRVKNITLSYTVPQKFTQRFALKAVKLFVSGEDLFTFDHLPSGVDPEDIKWTYPHSKTYSFGINLTL